MSSIHPKRNCVELFSGLKSLAFAFTMLAITLLLVYAPVVHTDFLYRDDNVYLTLPQGWKLTPITFAQARPAMGLVIDCLNSSVVVGSGLKHLIPLTGVGLIATSLFAWLRRYGVHSCTALPISLSICCLPSFQATIPYLSVAVGIYAALASSLAVQVQFARRIQSSVVRHGLSGLLLFIALSGYQPAAMFGWALFVVPLYLANQAEWVLLRRKMLQFGIVFGCTLMAYSLFYKFAVSSFGMSMSGRAETLSLALVPAKLSWLVSTLMPYAVQSALSPLPLWIPVAAPWLTTGASVIAIGGLIRQVWLGRATRDFICLVERSMLLVVLLVITYLPFVLLQENGQEQIYATGLQAALLLSVLLGFRQLVFASLPRPTSSRPRRQWIEGGWYAAVFCCLGLSASRAVLQEVVVPCHHRYRAVRHAIARVQFASLDGIYVIPDKLFLGAYAEGLVRGVVNEMHADVRRPLIASAWRSAPMAIHILEDVARARYGEEFHEYYRYDPVNRCYTLKDELTPSQRDAADLCFARFLQALEGSPRVAIVDLSREPMLSGAP